MILHPWSEELLTHCLVVGTSTLQTSAGAFMLALALRDVTSLGRGNPLASAPPAEATGACTHQSLLLVYVKGPCETN